MFLESQEYYNKKAINQSGIYKLKFKTKAFLLLKKSNITITTKLIVLSDLSIY